MSRSRFGLASLCAAVVLLGGCSSTVNTLPPRTSPADPVREYTLHLPPGLEVRAVDYVASLYSDVSGGALNVPTTTSVGGRAFVKVYAVHRETGEQYLLLYENIAQRSRPIQIIRFQTDPGTGVGQRN